MEAGGGSEGRCGGGVGDEGQEQQAGLEPGALGGGRQVAGEGKGGGNWFSLQVKASYRVLQQGTAGQHCRLSICLRPGGRHTRLRI